MMYPREMFDEFRWGRNVFAIRDEEDLVSVIDFVCFYDPEGASLTRDFVEGKDDFQRILDELRDELGYEVDFFLLEVDSEDEDGSNVVVREPGMYDSFTKWNGVIPFEGSELYN